MQRAIKRFIEQHKVLLGIGVVLLVSILALFGTQIWLYVNFLLGNDVIVSLDTSAAALSLQRGETQDITFTASVTTNPFCSATCTSLFSDLSFGGDVQETFILKPGVAHEKTFSVESGPIGKGQRLYRYAMECQSKQTTFCHTAAEPTRRSVLVTVNYTLSDDEQTVFTTYQHVLPQLRDQLSTLLGMQDVLLNTTFVTPQIDTASLVISLQRLEQFWNNEQYQHLQQQGPLFIDNLNTASDTARNRLFEIQVQLEQQEQHAAYLLKQRERIEELQSIPKLTQRQVQETRTLTAQYNDLVDQFIRNATQAFLDVDTILREHEEALEAYLAKRRTELQGASAILCNESSVCLLFAATNPCQNITVFNDALLTTNSTLQPLPACDLITTAYDSLQTFPTLNYTLPTVSAQPLLYTFAEPTSHCCLQGVCQACCTNETCKQKTYPVLFLHGHAFNKDVSAEYSLDAFNSLQQALEQDGYLDAGVTTLYTQLDTPKSVWSPIPVPLTIKASYYQDLFQEPENYVVIQTKSENIDTYAVRLKELIDTVQYKTGREKVRIVATSMGGLVARRYLQIFGESAVDRLILVAVPNKGIRGDVADYCPLVGEALECRDMQHNSLFLNKLNRGKAPLIPVDNIIATGCAMEGGLGDGIVLEADARLEGAEEIVIEGTCKGLSLLHTAVLDVQQYPALHDAVVSALS